MQAIVTKYFGPSNRRGSRVKATCSGGSLFFGYEPAMNVANNHKAACAALVAKMGWVEAEGEYFRGTWHDAGLPNGDMVHVFVSETDREVS